MSTMGDQWDGQSVSGVPSSMTSSSSAPYGSATDGGGSVGRSGLTPAQAYQAQVGVEAEGGVAPPRGPRPARPSPGPGIGYFPSSQSSAVPPHLGPSSHPANNLYDTYHSSPTPSASSSIHSASSSPQQSSYASNSLMPNPHSQFFDPKSQQHPFPSSSSITLSSSSVGPPRLPSFDASMGSSGLGLGTLPSLSMESDGGTITPRPSAYDDSELGYLGSGGASGQTSGKHSCLDRTKTVRMPFVKALTAC
jgi:hypothetical protein